MRAGARAPADVPRARDSGRTGTERAPTSVIMKVPTPRDYWSVSAAIPSWLATQCATSSPRCFPTSPPLTRSIPWAATGSERGRISAWSVWLTWGVGRGDDPAFADH
jgi:hypothetical protein